MSAIRPATLYEDRRVTPMDPAFDESLAAFIATLQCPYCGSALEVRLPSVPAYLDEYGVLGCNCHEYPVVAGIPILRQVDGLARVTELIREGETTRALLQALHVFRITWAHQSRWHTARYHLNCRRLVSDGTLSFEEAGELVRKPKAFADYLLHRFANPSLLAAIGPMLLLGDLAGHEKRRPPAVLDLACGAGHASFLIHHLHPGLRVIAADLDFVSLYLARRFVAPHARHLCWDVEAQSPLPDSSVDAVFCLDAFHYFKAKRGVVSELKRTATADAPWLFPHLHNALQHNLVPGVPMSPAGYQACFGFEDGRLYDEHRILTELSQRRVFDLAGDARTDIVDEARNLTYVRAPHASQREYHDFPAQLCTNRAPLGINPIYKTDTAAGRMRVQLVWPNQTIEQECSSVTAVLPEKHEEAADLNPALLDNERLEDLVARFILVPLPDGYLRKSRARSRVRGRA